MKPRLAVAVVWASLLGLTSQPLSAGSLPVSSLPPVQDADGRAGTCYSFYLDAGIRMAYDAGSRWERFDFSWRAIEPQNNQWNFGPHDSLVNSLQAGGMSIVGVLLWTPDWAATGGLGGLGMPRLDQRPPGWYAPVPAANPTSLAASPASSPPAGLYLPWSDPANHWGDFVYHVVSHYRDRVKYWEMWNEPDFSYFWSGTSTDYAQLLKVGYQAASAACPECVVLFGGLHYWANPGFYRWVLNTLKNDPEGPAHNYFFDLMSVHLYSRSSSIYDVVNTIRSGMREFVPEHPIWLTETGVAVWDDNAVDPDPTPYQWAATQQEAAAFVIQSYANAWAAGVERYFLFRMSDADMTEYFGLVRNKGSLRPAYVAYQVATNYLVSPTMATSVNYPSGVRRVTLWGTPRGKVSILWNTTPTTTNFSYGAILPTATLVDRWGATRTITATAGAYGLNLPGATANLGLSPTDYIIGGEPYLVIEADTIPPTATVRPLPTVTYSSTVPVSWEGADDAAGIWGFDLQVQQGAGSGWTDWLRLTQTIGITSAQYTDAQPGTTYCFRARAWDRAGNRGPWPQDPQACTSVIPERPVHLRLEGVFGDEDGNGVQNAGEMDLTQVSFRLVDASGADAVTPAVGSSLDFSATLSVGDYNLVVVPQWWPSPPPGWLPRWLPQVVEPGSGVQEINVGRVGLAPHRSSVYLPVVTR